jgi:spore germination protein GerM
VSKTNSGRNAVILAALAVLGIGGGVQYFRQNPQSLQTPVTSSSPALESGYTDAPATILPSAPPQQAGDPGTEVNRKELFILTVATNDKGSFLEKKSLDAGNKAGLSNSQEAERLLNAMADEGENSPLPKGTRAISVIFDNDLATVNFNNAFQKNFAGGDEDEALALNAVFATVGQFPGVKQVQILVEGQKIDSLGGNQPLTDPQPIPNNLALAQSEQ